jgi:hypothetical protein
MVRPRRTSPTSTARQLAALLVVARKDVGLTQETAARVAGWSKRKQQMLETAELVITEPDLAVLLDRFAIDPAEHGAWHELAAEARERSWWDRYDPSDLPAESKRFIGLEQGAVRMRCFEPLIIQGLLQTPAYRRAAVTATSPTPRPVEQVAALVEITERRQQVLVEPEPLDLWVVLDEAALRRAAGDPGVMREQLHLVADLAEQRENVTVQVVPFGAGMHAGLHGSFSLMEFGWHGDPGMLFAEMAADRPTYSAGREGIYVFSQVFDQLLTLALDPTQTLEMLRDIARDPPGRY